jgi:predicted transcriptional regulator
MGNKVYLAEKHELPNIVRALDSDLRRRILELLAKNRMNINQIAEALDIPQSTCTVNVQLLEKADLIVTEQVAASKGSQKVCSLKYAEIVLPIGETMNYEEENFVVTEMPIGLYTDVQISQPCGLLSDTSIIGYFDHVESFLNPKRAAAGLLWFSRGYVEYRFPREYLADSSRIQEVSVTAEICSEFPGYKNDWPSDITLWINGVEIGTWTSPGDMGGEYGRLTPKWWDLKNTQYGFLKTWRISDEGSFIDGVRSGNATLADAKIRSCDFFIVRIGVKPDATNFGGMNLFGRTFGNYENDLVFRMELSPK